MKQVKTFLCLFGFILLIGAGCAEESPQKSQQTNQQDTQKNEPAKTTTVDSYSNTVMKQLVDGDTLYIPTEFKADYISWFKQVDVDLNKDEMYELDLTKHSLPLGKIISIAISEDQSKIAYSIGGNVADYTVYNLEDKSKIEKTSDFNGTNYVVGFTEGGEYFETSKKQSQERGNNSCLISADETNLSVCHNKQKPPVVYKNKYILSIGTCVDYPPSANKVCKELLVKNTDNFEFKNISLQNSEEFDMISANEIKEIQNDKAIIEVEQYKGKDDYDPTISTIEVDLSDIKL